MTTETPTPPIRPAIESPFLIGLSMGHGGPRHDEGCVAGLACQACGTKAGVPYGMGTEAHYTRLLGEQFLGAVPSELARVIALNAPHETMLPNTRSVRAQALRCHFVIALHVNESPSASAHGGHMFYLTHPDGRRGVEDVAYEVASNWPAELRRNFYGSRLSHGEYIAGMIEPAYESYWPRANSLLHSYWPLPTLLIEAFYASNPLDVHSALRPEVQVAMVSAMLRGVRAAKTTFGPHAV